MKKIYKNKPFIKWQKKQMIADRVLLWAVSEIQAGLYDARLSAVLYKKRIPVLGRGKRSGARTLIAYKEGDHVFFLHGFLKNEQENISFDDQLALEKLARYYLKLSDDELNKVVSLGHLEEIRYEKTS